jgi:hypothetical protein
MTRAALPDPGGIVARAGCWWQGEVLFHVAFVADGFERRGWYDLAEPPLLSTAMHAPGSSSSLECRFAIGATTCSPRMTARRLFDGGDEIYVSYWVRYSDDWVGSGRPYHPHEIHFLTDADEPYTGPSYTHLTLYVEQVDLIPRIALQDGANVDARCILLNDDSVRGCNGGALADFPFGENRSVAACNGLRGPVALRDCYNLGGDQWYSSRAWTATGPLLAPGQERDGWHHVEVYVDMNSVQDGAGRTDGALRMWVDGTSALSVDSVLLRTGEHPDLRFNQILIAPYIGDGSPVAQTMWIDELTVARGRKP